MIKYILISTILIGCNNSKSDPLSNRTRDFCSAYLKCTDGDVVASRFVTEVLDLNSTSDLCVRSVEQGDKYIKYTVYDCIDVDITEVSCLKHYIQFLGSGSETCVIDK